MSSCRFTVMLMIAVATVLAPVSVAKSSKRVPKTVIHPFKKGGVLNEWLVLGPFSTEVENDSSKNASSVVPGIENDFLRALGGESKAVIKKYTSVRVIKKRNKRVFIKAKKFSADTAGTMWLDSLFTPKKDEVAYAFCMVEAFVTCSVRCYWGADKDAKVWVNGTPMHNTWETGDTCLPLTKYFDCQFTQGLNPVLVKLSDAGVHNRFAFEVWNLHDSLLPFQQRIHTLYCYLDRNEIRSPEDSLSVRLHFNIPVPAHFFAGTAVLLRDPDRSSAREKIASRDVFIGEAVALPVRKESSGVLSVEADVNMGEEREMKTVRYVWCGDFKAAINSQKTRYNDLAKKIEKYISKNLFVSTVASGMFHWGERWFDFLDSLPIDKRVRQLGYIHSNAEMVESLLKGEPLVGGVAYPLLYPVQMTGKDTVEPVYEPSQWLNYKFPETYALPHEIDGAAEYQCWLYLPETAAKKRRKMPLILSLSGKNGRGHDIDILESFGPGGYAQTVKDFPYAVITPQCRYKTLWDARVIKRILDLLITTGRFKKNKLYLTGTGMGAFTAWHLAATFPGLFAGVIPINGGNESERACAVKNVSIWAFHGGKNDVVPLEIPQDMITAVKECGSRKIKFSIYAEHGHDMYSILYNDPRLYIWLKKH